MNRVSHHHQRQNHPVRGAPHATIQRILRPVGAHVAQKHGGGPPQAHRDQCRPAPQQGGSSSRRKSQRTKRNGAHTFSLSRSDARSGAHVERCSGSSQGPTVEARPGRSVCVPFQKPTGLADGLGVERSPSTESVDSPLPVAPLLFPGWAPRERGAKRGGRNRRRGTQAPRWVPRARRERDARRRLGIYHHTQLWVARCQRWCMYLLSLEIRFRISIDRQGGKSKLMHDRRDSGRVPGCGETNVRPDVVAAVGRRDTSESQGTFTAPARQLTP